MQASEGAPSRERVNYTHSSTEPSGNRFVNPAAHGTSGHDGFQLNGSSSPKRPVEISVQFFPVVHSLQGTEVLNTNIPEISLERLIPPVDFLAAWRVVPNVSQWVSATQIQWGTDHDSWLRAGSGDGTGSPFSSRMESILKYQESS